MNAFKEFYKQQKDKFFNYLMRMTADFELARDLMQESFARYLENYGQDHLAPALLYTIGRNALLDHARKNSRSASMPHDTPDETRDQEEFYLVRENYRRVLTAMQTLPADEREILALVVGSELNYKEIAAVVGISEANVKVKVHRARVKLKKIISAGEP